jgi:enamine deaminase RidA (YjgF/YER057c/UK114 family)
MEHLGLFGSVKNDYLKDPYPAWTAIGVAALFMPGVLVEIRAIAKL